MRIISNLIPYLVIFFLFFPYIVVFFPFPTDIQPWFVIIGLLWSFYLIFSHKEKFTYKQIFLITFFLYMFLQFTINVFLFSSGNFNDRIFILFRLGYKYISLVVLTLLYYKILLFIRKQKNFLVLTVIIYSVITFLQAITGKVIVDVLLSRKSLIFGRNAAIGLTPEPSFLAKISLFFVLIGYFLYLIKDISLTNFILVFTLSIVMIFISLSISGFVLLGVLILITILFNIENYIIKFFHKKGKLTTLIMFFIFLVFLVTIFLFVTIDYVKIRIDTDKLGRLGVFLKNLNSMEKIAAFLNYDVSFQARLKIIYLSFSSLQEAPFGSPKDSPVGGFLGLILETGYIGVFFLVFYLLQFFYIIKTKNYNFRRYLLILFFFVPIYIFVDTLSAPFFEFLLISVFLLPDYNVSKDR